MVQVIFVDDDINYIECIQEYFSNIYRDTKVQIKTFLITRDPQTIVNAKNRIIQDKPQVLFVDLGLPHIDGCKLIEKIIEKTEKYNPVMILTSAMPDVFIHKGEAHYVLMKQNDYVIFKEIIDLMVDFSGDVEDVLNIEQKIEALEEKHAISYHEIKALHQILTRFRESKNYVEVTYEEMQEVTNKSYGAIMQLLYRLRKKLGLEKMKNHEFLWLMKKINYIRDIVEGEENDK